MKSIGKPHFVHLLLVYTTDCWTGTDKSNIALNTISKPKQSTSWQHNHKTNPSPPNLPTIQASLSAAPLKTTSTPSRTHLPHLKQARPKNFAHNLSGSPTEEEIRWERLYQVRRRAGSRIFSVRRVGARKI